MMDAPAPTASTIVIAFIIFVAAIVVAMWLTQNFVEGVSHILWSEPPY